MGKPNSKKNSDLNNYNNNPFQGNKKIKDEFNCPLCNFHFYKNVTYNQLNKHLSICGRRHIYALFILFIFIFFCSFLILYLDIIFHQ